MRKQFLVLSGDSSVRVLTSRLELYRFAKAWGYSIRQILIGLEYEGQWVGVNHSIQELPVPNHYHLQLNKVA